MKPFISLVSLFLTLLIGGCAETLLADAPATKNPSGTTAQNAVKIAKQNPEYTPLVGAFLERANAELPKDYFTVTILKTEFQNRDIVTFFEYYSIRQWNEDVGDRYSLYWREVRDICRDPVFLKLERDDFLFYTQTIFRDGETTFPGALRSITEEVCDAIRF
jgi:hypothetical protein